MVVFNQAAFGLTPESAFNKRWCLFIHVVCNLQLSTLARAAHSMYLNFAWKTAASGNPFITFKGELHGRHTSYSIWYENIPIGCRPILLRVPLVLIKQFL